MHRPDEPGVVAVLAELAPDAGHVGIDDPAAGVVPVAPDPVHQRLAAHDHARVAGESLALTAFVGLPDGSEWIRDGIEADAGDPLEAGTELAERLLAAGAAELVARAEEMTL